MERSPCVHDLTSSTPPNEGHICNEAQESARTTFDPFKLHKLTLKPASKITVYNTGHHLKGRDET